MKTLGLFIVICMLNAFSMAQCEDGRYMSTVFDNYSITSDVQYGSNHNYQGILQDLHFDVYEPAGDIESNRPCIVIAHGGSFIAGSKDGPDVVPFCIDFAKMGYVVVSIQYRLGLEQAPVFPNEQTTIEGVIRGYHDFKAAIRFLRKTVAEDGNPFEINPEMIFGAGVSAGAFCLLHAVYLDDLSEFPSVADTTKLGLGGGLIGLTGNPNFSSDLVAGINIAGAIKDSAYIDEGDMPLVSFHGTEDGTVPYGSAIIQLLGIVDITDVDGSSSIHARLNELSIENCFEIQENQDHVPHVSNSAYYDTLVVVSRNFLARYTCGIDLTCDYESIFTNLADLERIESIIAYPNPGNGVLNVDLDKFNGEKHMALYDLQGRLLKTMVTLNSREVLDFSSLDKGIYILAISDESKYTGIRVIIE